MLIAFVSGKTAPGVTTSAWALALSWPADVIAVDADPAGGDMIAGLLAGRASAEQGLLSWSIASRRVMADDAAAQLDAHTVTLPEATHVQLMPGLQSPSQATTLAGDGWDRLADALRHATRDVLADCGRLGDNSPWPIIRAADRVLLVARGTVRSVHAARHAAGLLQNRLGDLNQVGLLLVGAGPYPAAVVSAELHTATAGELPDDRATAAVLSDGAARARSLPRTKLLRAARAVAETLHAASGNRRIEVSR